MAGFDPQDSTSIDEPVPDFSANLNGSLQGLRIGVQWYLDNLEWCRRVQDGSYQGERLGCTDPKDLIA